VANTRPQSSYATFAVPVTEGGRNRRLSRKLHGARVGGTTPRLSLDTEI